MRKGVVRVKRLWVAVCICAALMPRASALSASAAVTMDADTGETLFASNADSRLPKIFRNRKEVGIRVPDNAIIREICRLLDAPILTTTLPLEEGEDIEYITEPELIDEKFGEEVDLIIDGGTGGIEPSTVINCCDDVPEIVRQGKGILNE